MRVVRLAMIAGAAVLPLAAIAQTPRVTQLNRTVIVTPGVNVVVPPECEQGLAPQPQPRVMPEERAAVTPVTVPAPPPSADLRGTLQAAVDAAQRRDRNTFNDRLAHAKEMLASYPPGAERNAANEVIAVLDDVKRLWDYEFASPTGAFFDASSDAYRMMSRYPGYDAAVRRQIITDQNGTKFYPAAESRDFLVSDAATRLARLTGHAATTTTTTTPPVEKAPQPQVTHKRPTLKQHHVTKPAPTTTTTTTTPPKPHKAVKRTHRRVEKAAVTPAPHHAKQATTTAVAKTAPKPAPKPVAAKEAPAPATQPPVTTSSAPAETTASTTIAPPPPAPPTTPTTAATVTTASAAQPQTETQPAPAAKQSPRSNLILPIILIILGVGVLVFFSRSNA